MLNAIGLANMGVTAFVRDVLGLLEEAGVTVIANIFAEDADELARVAETLSATGSVAALELNVSCPNVQRGGVHFGRDPEMAASLTRHIVERVDLPVIVKLTPEAPDVTAVALACEQAGAAALSAINTIRAMAVDVHTRRPRLGSVHGGLSGPAIRPVALRIVHDVARAVSIPVVGIGGIATAEHALEFLMAGASAVQVGTASFLDPRAPLHVLEGLRSWCACRHTTIRETVGSLLLDEQP
jgi:dihydroorotate dehydrogenase (NAD+) catalytic subunit